MQLISDSTATEADRQTKGEISMFARSFPSSNRSFLVFVGEQMFLFSLRNIRFDGFYATKDKCFSFATRTNNRRLFISSYMYLCKCGMQFDFVIYRIHFALIEIKSNSNVVNPNATIFKLIFTEQNSVRGNRLISISTVTQIPIKSSKIFENISLSFRVQRRQA